jgi:hypothetical protein
MRVARLQPRSGPRKRPAKAVPVVGQLPCSPKSVEEACNRLEHNRVVVEDGRVDTLANPGEQYRQRILESLLAAISASNVLAKIKNKKNPLLQWAVLVLLETASLMLLRPWICPASQQAAAVSQCQAFRLVHPPIKCRQSTMSIFLRRLDSHAALRLQSLLNSVLALPSVLLCQ